VTVRALWVTNDLPPRSGGIEQFLGSLLARSDPEATRVLASAWPGADKADAEVAYEVRRVGRRPLLPTPRLLRRMRAEIDDFGADVVVFGAAWPLAELAPYLPVPRLALTHGHEAGLARVGGGPLVRHGLRGLDAVGVISDYTRRLLQPWIAPTTTVRHLPPGVDTEVFRPDAEAAGIRARDGIPAGVPLVVCISRLVARKGQDVLIAAWPHVLRAVPDARLLLVGTGPSRRRIEADIAARGLGHRIVLAGEVSWRELPRYHAAADLFAMPCRTRLGGLDVEGLGIVFLEAQACGVPVVAGMSGGAPEAVRDGETGLVVDGHDAAAVSRAVIELLVDADRRAAMGAAGRRFVQGHYAWPVIVARLSEMLEETRATRASG
jgi:phosphatidyl-myo-inositol dimannoside synthase